MSPCSPNDVSINIPDGPSGPAIPGFGTPFALKLPNLNPFPDGFPENLLGLLDSLQLLVPPGALRAPLNPNFGKDVFDAIMKLLDQFMPFLMLYKFFLPILHLIICIIEVLCALLSPFKLPGAISRLFRNCIPEFLNLFPIFALIIMIISLLLLILALIEYIIGQVIKFVKMILRNIIALKKAFSDGDAGGVLAIAQKLGSLLCIFQNLFVLFAIFNIIIQVIKDILSLAFSIPPCDDGDPNDEKGCCTPDVCPAIVKTDYTRNTGTFKYLNQVGLATALPDGLPEIFKSFFSFNIRNESWQLYDVQQPIEQQFRNIFDAYDVTNVFPKPIFFPTDSVLTAQTALRQCPYTIDLRVFYNPADWGRPVTTTGVGKPRFIRFRDCIVTNVPSVFATQGDNTLLPVVNGVVNLVGGKGYEDDDTTVLTGYTLVGTQQVPIGNQATLENFLHKSSFTPNGFSAPVLTLNDGKEFHNVTYKFKPNTAPLLSKNLVTLGCLPDVALNRAFINKIVFTGISLKTKLVGDIVGGPGFPDPAATQQCLAQAVAALRSNMTEAGAALFQATCMLCLNDLKTKTNKAIVDMVGAGFEACSSTFTVTPTTQFTSQAIKVKVNLTERNGHSLTTGLSPEIAENLAARIKQFSTFGEVDKFVYDGYQSFTANITSPIPGDGTILISFDDEMFCTNTGLGTLTAPADITVAPEHKIQEIAYKFIYTPVGPFISGVPTSDSGQRDSDSGQRDSEGSQPRRDEGDSSRDNPGGEGGG